MIKESHNKDMNSVETKQNKGIAEEEFFFSGGLDYHPLSIKAESYAQALDIWETTKKPVGDKIVITNK